MIAVFLIAMILAGGFVVLLLKSPLAQWSLDRANHRSLHLQPTPRVGGIAMLFAVAIAIIISRHGGLPVIALALALCLALVSLVDDKANLSAALRLFAHATAATLYAVCCLNGSEISGAIDTSVFRSLTSPYVLISIVIAICWMTNLFNFMDGANGLAGGMAFVGFGGYAIAATMGAENGGGIAMTSAAISGAALGFLFFNFPTARVFLGDTGSVPIGFLAIVLGAQGFLQGLWPWWFGPFIFSAFIVDATVTLLKRLFRGEKIWVAHREHYYQRLILSGWSHHKTVLSYYFLILGSTISALIAQSSNLLYPIVGFWVITYASLILYLEWRFYQEKKVESEKTLGFK